MAYPFPSEAWLDAFHNVLNSNERYAEIAKNWEGDIQFVVEPEDPASEEGTIALYMDLWHGTSRKSVYLPEPDPALDPKYILQAPIQHFLAILRGDLDPMQAMLTRRLKVKGDMGYMLRNIPVVLQFVRCAQMVEIES
jgi:putative sterol carrier protein